MYTRAFREFQARLDEVSKLQTLARQLEAKRRPISVDRARALCRAGVVLLCSHIEGYVEDLVEVILERIFIRKIKKKILGDQFLYHFSKDILRDIKDTNDPGAIAAKILLIFQRDTDIWGSDLSFQSALAYDRFIADFHSPSFDKIARMMNRFGYTGFKGDMARSLRANFSPCVNMINNVIDQRNKIAHGDLVVTSTPQDLTDMMRLVEQFCRCMDGVTAAWFSNLRCAIRP